VLFLDTRIAFKHSLKKEIFPILKVPGIMDGEDPPLFKLVDELTAKLKDKITFVIEYPYVEIVFEYIYLKER